MKSIKEDGTEDLKQNSEEANVSLKKEKAEMSSEVHINFENTTKKSFAQFNSDSSNEDSTSGESSSQIAVAAVTERMLGYGVTKNIKDVAKLDSIVGGLEKDPFNLRNLNLDRFSSEVIFGNLTIYQTLQTPDIYKSALNYDSKPQPFSEFQFPNPIDHALKYSNNSHLSSKSIDRDCIEAIELIITDILHSSQTQLEENSTDEGLAAAAPCKQQRCPVYFDQNLVYPETLESIVN